MLHDLPYELLLTILSHIPNLSPLSTTTRPLSASVRDYQASQLRSRLSRLPHASLLITIFSPPTFFPPPSHPPPPPPSSSSDLLNLLSNPSLLTPLNTYLTFLESRASTATLIASHLLHLLPALHSSFPDSRQRREFAEKCVIWLWAGQVRYRYDVDGYLASLATGSIGWGFERLVREREGRRGGCWNYGGGGCGYGLRLSEEEMGWARAGYEVLAKELRPPFLRREGQQEGEGLWLWRVVVREGMEVIGRMLERRG